MHERIEQFFANLRNADRCRRRRIENRMNFVSPDGITLPCLRRIHPAADVDPNSPRGPFCFFFCGGRFLLPADCSIGDSRVLTARKKVDAELDEIFRVLIPMRPL